MSFIGWWLRGEHARHRGEKNLDDLDRTKECPALTWKLADAKNRFSEVVRLALTEGPQRVARRGDAVIVVAETEYRELTGERPSFTRYLLGGTDEAGFDGLDFGRERSPMRDVEF